MIINLTKEVGEYLKEHFVQCLVKDLGIGEDLDDTEGKMRDSCYEDISCLFDDAMDEFTLSDAIDDAIDELNQKIKDALFEQSGENCTFQREDDIDQEIGAYEKQIEKLEELE